MTALGPALAANVRRRRDAAGLSLAELADAAGIAKGSVAAIEGGRANPTVETISALARALGCTPGDLLTDTPDPMLVEVRATQALEPVGAVDGRVLQRFTPTGPVEVYEIVLPEPGTRRSEPHPRGVYEHVWVAQGAITLGRLDDPHHLSTGDYVCFAGWHEHVYETTEAPARLLMLLSYVRSVPVLAHRSLT